MARLSPTKSQAQLQLDDGYLLALARQGSHDAYDRLVRRYASFVRLKASSYFLVGGDSEDLIQEGLVGLYKAIRDFRPDRESSFRNFAELCITRQIITAVKTATRNKHTPLNGYVSFSATPAGARSPSRASTRCCPARPSRPGQPGDLLRGAALARRCLSTVLSELESRVLGLYLDGYSYTSIGEKLGCDCKTVDNALQRVKRKVGAHLQSRAVLNYERSYSLHALAHHPGRLRRPDRRRHLRPQPPAARSRPAFDRALAQVDRDLAAAAAATAAGTARCSRPPPAASARSSSAPSRMSLTLVEVIDRPGTDEDQAVFDVNAGGARHRVVLGRRDGDWMPPPDDALGGSRRVDAGAGARPRRARPARRRTSP